MANESLLNAKNYLHIRTHNSVSCWIQPPYAENRTYGGVGGVTGESRYPDPINLTCGLLRAMLSIDNSGLKSALQTLLFVPIASSQ